MAMTNAEWMIKNGYKFSELRWSFTQPDICRFYLNDKNVGKVSSLSIFEAIKTWLDAEHIEPILDEAEKNYLSAVIRPFRNNVTGIHKTRACNSTRCRISISVLEHGSCELPWFDDGTMYKGMEICKKYTPEELGL